MKIEITITPSENTKNGIVIDGSKLSSEEYCLETSIHEIYNQRTNCTRNSGLKGFQPDEEFIIKDNVKYVILASKEI